MAQTTMYSAMPNSPQTELSAGITETDGSINVVNAALLPATPNLATLGTDEMPETILYTGKSGNSLTGVTRGFNGTTARAWNPGTKVARYFTAYDHDAFRGNIADHETRLAPVDTATSAATAGTLVKRDANGRAQVAAPSAAGDIARKDTVDGAIAAHKAEADPHTGYVKKAGDTMTDVLWTPKIILTGADGPEGGEIQYAKPINGTDLNYDVIGDVQGNKMRFFENGGKYTGAHINLKKGPGVDDNELVASTVRDLTFYIRTDGSDNNTGTANTAAGAFKTIGKAISMIPQVVNHNVNINVAPGTYNETVYLHGFTGKGILFLNGAESASNTHMIISLEVIQCGCRVIARGFKLTDTGLYTLFASGCTFVELGCFTLDSTSVEYGIHVVNAKVQVYNCVISNRYAAIFANVGADIYATNNTGSGNVVACLSLYTGRICYAGDVPGANSISATGNGGLVTNNGVINPWGDNTTNNRSVMSAYHDTAQTIEAATYTKLLYKAEYYDMLSEYNPTTSRFTATKFGIYSVRASMYFVAPGTGILISLFAYLNGSNVRYIDQGFTNAGGDHQSHGAITIPLNAGDYVEIYMYSSAPVTTTPSEIASLFEVVRLA